MPPVSSGGTTLLQMLNILEGYDLRTKGALSAASIHLATEAMRRAFADRARYLGDPDFNPEMPVARLVSKEYAAELRKTIREDRASVSAPDVLRVAGGERARPPTSRWSTRRATPSPSPTPSRTATASKIVVPGAGFLLNNEMGDFNAGPGLTNADGLVGTAPNLAAPGKRMLSSMTPTILARDGKVFMVIGSPGGRTIINTVLECILGVVDFGLNIQEAIDAPRFHHQWLPDRIRYERIGFSPDTIALLRAKGHDLRETGAQGIAEGIVYDAKEDCSRAARTAAPPTEPRWALAGARRLLERQLHPGPRRAAAALARGAQARRDVPPGAEGRRTRPSP